MSGEKRGMCKVDDSSVHKQTHCGMMVLTTVNQGSESGSCVKLRLHGTRQAARLRRDSRAAEIET